MPRLVMMVLCLGVTFASIRSFLAEYRVFLHLNGTTSDLIDTLADKDRPLIQPYGARTARDLMAACGRVMLIAPRLKSDAELAVRVARSCGDIAEFVLLNSPSNARALALAVVASNRVDHDLYARAQAAAPFDPWSLNLRLAAIGRDPSLAEGAASLAEADFRHALLSRWGQQAVAALYRDSEPLRPTIARAAEHLPRDEKAAFLGTLRRTVGGAG